MGRSVGFHAMKKEHLYEIVGLFIFALTILVFLSLLSHHPEDLSFYTSHPNVPPKNWVNIFGAYLSEGLTFLFGYAAYAVPVFLFFFGLKFVRREPVR
ncbi:MAG: DNA translocase FtsK 4TM domain-containing protein, partial [Deltaproteobacteria bacterium]